ncbi:MAG: transporter substrate-binding domain-containing protein [Actinomycetota bacterium]|nr:transporter substrate-binding domain-containing protein [Actinomycetota bacterium]
MQTNRLLALVGITLALAVAAVGCGGDEDEAAPQTTAAGAPDACAKDQLELVEPGQLTIATDNPAFPPWFENAEGGPWDPTKKPTKRGYEAAVAYAVAEELGFSDSEVQWVVVPFDNAFKPGPKDFDFDINQISYTKERDQAVDFSDSYYDVQQAVVALKSSEFANATSLGDLKGAKLGAPLGTTSFEIIESTIQPGNDPAVFNTLNDAISALKNRQVDGVVVDLPTSFFITAVQVPNGKLVGQVAAESQEYFGLVFEEGNPLRDCVNEALASLRDDGTLEQLEQEWITNRANARVLE